MDTITVTPNGYRIIDGNEQVTFFTLTVGGVAYKWHGNTPRLEGQALADYLTAHAEEYLCGIHRKMYVEAAILPEPGESELEAWTRWIAAGCKNIRQIEVDGAPSIQVIEEPIPLIPWKDTHPVNAEAVMWE